MVDVEQMPRGAIGAGLQIYHDAGHVGQRHAAIEHNHRDARLIAQAEQILRRDARAQNDDAAHRLADEHAQHLHLALRIFARVKQQRQQMVGGGFFLHPARDLGEIGIEDIGHQQRDGLASRRGRRGGAQRLITEGLHRRQHAVAHRLAHRRGVVEHA
jgi:hypothetical protein